MRISASRQKALNDQIWNEQSRADPDLSMAAHFAEQTVNGFARWQAMEAGKPAMKLS
jgi:ferritin